MVVLVNFIFLIGCRFFTKSTFYQVFCSCPLPITSIQVLFDNKKKKKKTSHIWKRDGKGNVTADIVRPASGQRTSKEERVHSARCPWVLWGQNCVGSSSIVMLSQRSIIFWPTLSMWDCNLGTQSNTVLLWIWLGKIYEENFIYNLVFAPYFLSKLLGYACACSYVCSRALS